MEADQDNLYMCPIGPYEKRELQRTVYEGEFYENVQSRDGKVRGQSRKFRNLDANIAQHAANEDAIQNVKNESNKCKRVVIALLALSVLSALVLSAVSIVMLIGAQKSTLAEIKVMEGLLEKQQADINEMQYQDIELNRSLTVLRDQTNYTQESIRADIRGMKGDINVSLTSSQLLSNVSEQHRLDIAELYRLVGKIRLVGGSRNYGRVEILHNETWGTICDDYWDINDATVVCRMLGYQSASSAPLKATYGQGFGKIWLDDVKCTGKEATIYECPKASWGSHNCAHSNDASVVCIV